MSGGHTRATDIETVARDVFQFNALRAPQRAALTSIIAGQDTLAVLPTGSGKSAIYQIAGLILGGLTVVVSPLIALQRDQLRTLDSRRHPGGSLTRAVALNSSLHVSDRARALADLQRGALDFVLLGPEQLVNPATHQALLACPRPVTLLAVDEAHLVSQWGHDFRPEYLRLGDTIEELGHPPVLALTATAAPPVQADITRELRMVRPSVVVAGFDRPNISLAVRTTNFQGRGFAGVIVDHTLAAVMAATMPALVYAPSRASCEELSERLRQRSVAASPYHAGLPAAQRSATQDAFLAGGLDVVVATSAFGMGIDKSDVRSVIHAGAPSSLDEYYQEIGRAGRDGQPASAELIFDPATLRLPRLFASRSRLPTSAIRAVVAALAHAPMTLAQLATTAGVGRQSAERVVDELAELAIVRVTAAGVSVPKRQRLADAPDRLGTASAQRVAVLGSRVDSVRHYAETQHCRRAELLAYFGEAFPPPCGRCDNDVTPAQGGADGLETVAGTRSGCVPGQHVIHRLWGEGTVLACDEHELLVAFESVGYRHLTPAVLANGLLSA